MSETITVVEHVAEEGGEEIKEGTGSKTSKRLSVVTSSQYNLLEQKVSQLEGQLSDTVPKNKDLLSKTQRGSKSVSEMWQMMNMVARMEAAEAGMEKLSSIIEDLSHECHQIKQELGMPSATSISTTDVRGHGAGGHGAGGHGAESHGAESHGAGGRGAARDEDKERRGSGGRLEGSTSIVGLIDGLLIDFDVLKGEVKELSNIFTTFKSNIPEELTDGNGSGLNMNHISGMDAKFCEIDELITRLDNAFNNQMNIFQDQVTDIEKEVMGIWENINNRAEAEARASGAGEFLSKILVVQEEMEGLNGKVHRLNEDKDEKTLKINVLNEELEILKTVKADMQEVEYLLEEKADLVLTNTKLSIAQFDIAYANMTESLNEAHIKLTNQEITLRNTLDEMEREMELKLFREELSPLRDSLTEKIRKLHERLKVIENMKKEAEAAGTKSKYLKDVNCISCDNKVVMLRGEEVPQFPGFKPLPTHPRQAQPGTGPGEQGLSRDMQQANESLCNRYCGGAHTMTTAQQRVQRGGNFATQFGLMAVAIEKPGAARRPSSAPVMRDQAVMARLSAEMKEEELLRKKSISADQVGPPSEKPRGSKASIAETVKPTSAASLKEGARAKSKSGSRRSSVQKVAEEGAAEGGEQVASRQASVTKQGSATSAASAPKQASVEAVGGEEAAPEEAPAPAEGEEAPAPAEGEEAPAEEAPLEEAPPEEAPAEEAPPEEEAPAEE